MKLDTLDALSDDDLRAVMGRADALLKQHDAERKEKALSDARTLLASVGLGLKDLTRKSVRSKGPVYHTGRTYRHPANSALVWPGKGKKPQWLTALESEGGKAIEFEAVANKRSNQ